MALHDRRKMQTKIKAYYTKGDLIITLLTRQQIFNCQEWLPSDYHFQVSDVGVEVYKENT